MAAPAFYTELKGVLESEGPGKVRELFTAEGADRTSFEPGRMLESLDTHTYHKLRSAGYAQTAHFLSQEADLQLKTRFSGRAKEATDTGNFLNIISQFSYANFLEGYTNPEFVLTALVPVMEAATTEEEKIPGITDYGDEMQERGEGHEFHEMGVSEDWILSPKKRDFGGIAALTFEAIFNIDSKVGGRLVTNQSDAGRAAGIRKEKVGWRAFTGTGAEGQRARYNWRGFGQLDTYGNDSGNHTWDNLAATNGLTNWQQLDTANQLFLGMVNPYNLEPISIRATHLVVGSSNKYTGMRILNATEDRSGDTPAGAGVQTITANTVVKNLSLSLLTSQWLDLAQETATDWFLSAPSQLLRWMQVDPMDVVSAPALNDREFRARIVAQWRVAEFGDYMVYQPRASVKNTVAG